MRWLVVALLLVGCTEQDLALREVVAGDEPLDEIAERTEVRWIGQARLTPDGPVIDADHQRSAAWSRERVSVVEVGERLRIVADQPYARLLLWLDPEDLGTWVIEDASGGARPGRLDGQTGVFFQGGTDVEVTATDGDWTAVAASARDFDVEVWLPRFEVGPYWVERDREAAYVDAEVWLRGGAELLDAPHGDAMGTVRDWSGEDQPDLAHLDAGLLDRSDGHALVEVIQDGISVVAWVPEEQVSAQAEGGHGMSCCGGCGGAGYGWASHPSLVLPEGTPLYSGPNGEWVGETRRERGWSFGDEVDGWTPIVVPSHWGQATVWVW